MVATLKNFGLKVSGPIDQLQMLGSCVYSTKVAAMQELQGPAKNVGDPIATQLRRAQLQVLVEFCNAFLAGFSNAKPDFPGVIPTSLKS